MTASSCWSTSSIRTNRSTHPNRGPPGTTSRWTGPHLIWPPYTDGAIRKGVLSEDQARQVRAQYGAKLSMIDAWFGRMLDALDRGGFWDDTVVVVCTDHGHFLGEKDIWGKPSVPVYEPLGHIPLFVALARATGGRLRRADHERGPARHDRRGLRRHLAPSHPRSLDRAARERATPARTAPHRRSATGR